MDYGPISFFCRHLLRDRLVVTPFLPGDSLIFAAGTFAARGDLNVLVLFLILAAAAVLGDTANYWIGKIIGPKVFQKENSRIFKKAYLERTHGFYEKYGAETIIIARFVPIVRTFAPFVAGIGRMSYGKFLSYNVVGGVGWVALSRSEAISSAISPSSGKTSAWSSSPSS